MSYALCVMGTERWENALDWESTRWSRAIPSFVYVLDVMERGFSLKTPIQPLTQHALLSSKNPTKNHKGIGDRINDNRNPGSTHYRSAMPDSRVHAADRPVRNTAVPELEVPSLRQFPDQLPGTNPGSQVQRM